MTEIASLDAAFNGSILTGISATLVLGPIAFLILYSDIITGFILAPLYVLQAKIQLLKYLYVKFPLEIFAERIRFIRTIYVAYTSQLISLCEEYLTKGLTYNIMMVTPFREKTQFEELIHHIKVCLKLGTDDDNIKFKFARLLKPSYTHKELKELINKPFELLDYWFYASVRIQYTFAIPFHLPALVNIDSYQVGVFIDSILKNQINSEEQVKQLVEQLNLDNLTKRYIHELVYFIYGYTIGDFITPYILKKITLLQGSWVKSELQKFPNDLKDMLERTSMNDLNTYAYEVTKFDEKAFSLLSDKLREMLAYNHKLLKAYNPKYDAVELEDHIIEAFGEQEIKQALYDETMKIEAAWEDRWMSNFNKLDTVVSKLPDDSSFEITNLCPVYSHKIGKPTILGAAGIAVEEPDLKKFKRLKEV